jgi:neutral ceramidase
VALNGYADLKQRSYGIHTRLFARSYIINHSNKTILFINTDIQSPSHGIREKVIEVLKTKYGNKYDYDNVCITSTHNHG